MDYAGYCDAKDFVTTVEMNFISSSVMKNYQLGGKFPDSAASSKLSNPITRRHAENIQPAEFPVFVLTLIADRKTKTGK